MNINVRLSSRILCFILLIFLACILSCSGTIPSQNIKQDTPIWKKYKKIIFQKFEIDPDLEKDYPDAASACESTAMNELLRKSSITTIQKARVTSSHESDTLIIRTTVTTLRMSGGVVHPSDGTPAGTAEMAVDLQLVDAASRRVIREKFISTADAVRDNSRGAVSDRSLPYDLGHLIAEYIAEVVDTK